VAGSAPDPAGGSEFTAHPAPRAVVKGPTSKRREGADGRGRQRERDEEGKRMGRGEGLGPKIFWHRQASSLTFVRQIPTPPVTSFAPYSLPFPFSPLPLPLPSPFPGLPTLEVGP